MVSEEKTLFLSLQNVRLRCFDYFRPVVVCVVAINQVVLIKMNDKIHSQINGDTIIDQVI